jgi:hypothetical protein
MEKPAAEAAIAIDEIHRIYAMSTQKIGVQPEKMMTIIWQVIAV